MSVLLMLVQVTPALVVRQMLSPVAEKLADAVQEAGAVLAADLELVERLGGGDPLAISLSINVGSSLVDVSPLSTIGALCVAAVTDPEAARRLFRQMMIWGLAMTVVGALLGQFLAGPLARL